MLVDLTINNWMSYRDEASLSLVKTSERHMQETCAPLPGFRTKKVLPLLAVYGGNASGKTGLFKALLALRSIIVTDPGVDGSLPVFPFALDASSSRPTEFDVTFLAGERLYRYVLHATREMITYEALSVLSERGETDVFEREAGSSSLAANASEFSDAEHLHFAFKSTRRNQAFLQSAVAQNIAELRGAYDWFARTLELVGVGSNSWSFAKAAERNEGFLEFAGETLSRLDTGVSALVGDEVPIEALPQVAPIRRGVADLHPGEVMTVIANEAAGDYGFEMFTARVEAGGLIIRKVRAEHRGPGGERHLLDLSEESSGTQRLLGLMPMLFSLGTEPSTSKVFVVDELDRCFHTVLTRGLIEEFRAGCSGSTRRQLLFTTHDLMVMDQDLLRRDEMYIAERALDGTSCITALSDYRGLRKDKDLVKSYLDGRFGGLPAITGDIRDD